MKTYRVTWEIDVEADNPRQAAEKALEIQRDKSSIATVFHVSAGGKSIDVIDLED